MGKIWETLAHSRFQVRSRVFNLFPIYSNSLLDQRWYMFQNMGPAPSARSGHAMASIGPRVFVLGGLGAEFMNPTKPEDPTLIHVLDTSMLFLPFTQSLLTIAGRAHQVPRLEQDGPAECPQRNQQHEKVFCDCSFTSATHGCRFFPHTRSLGV